MKDMFNSIIAFVRPSKRAILLITTTTVITLVVGSIIAMWLSRVTDLNIPSIAHITALGVEAYWDKNLENKTETFDWGKIYPDTSRNVTLFLRSISNIETTLYLNATNWKPADISSYMNLSWNYDETVIHPGEAIEVTLQLSASSSPSFYHYLFINDIEEFSLNITITTSEYVS